MFSHYRGKITTKNCNMQLFVVFYQLLDFAVFCVTLRCKLNIESMGLLLRSILLFVMTLLLGACVRPVLHNFPPADSSVQLDSTNLPIVWIDIEGDSIMRDTRIGGT